MCMNLQELKEFIDLAIKDCERVIKKNPKAILSEGDLERLLSFYISKRIKYNPKRPNPDAFAVYSQISHYDVTNVVDARVDLLLLKPGKIEPSIGKNKRFIYKSDESFAIELKYQHTENKKAVSEAKKDIRKYIKYKDNSYYYAIILVDGNESTSKFEKEILSYYEKKKKEFGNEYNNKFFCKVLKKKAE